MSLTPISQIKNVLIFSFLFVLVENSLNDGSEERSIPTINSPIVPKPNEFLPSPGSAEKSADDVVEVKKEDLNLISQQNNSIDLQVAVSQNNVDMKTVDLKTQKVQNYSKSGTEDDKRISNTSMGSTNADEKKESLTLIGVETPIKDSTEIMGDDGTKKFNNNKKEKVKVKEKDNTKTNNNNTPQDTNKDFTKKINIYYSLNNQRNNQNNSTITDISTNEYNNANTPLKPTFNPTTPSFTNNNSHPDANLNQDSTPIINPSNPSILNSSLSSPPIIPSPPTTMNYTPKVKEYNDNSWNMSSSTYKATNSNDHINQEPNLVLNTAIRNIFSTPSLITQMNSDNEKNDDDEKNGDNEGKGDDKENDYGDIAAPSSTITPFLIPNEHYGNEHLRDAMGDDDNGDGMGDDDIGDGMGDDDDYGGEDDYDGDDDNDDEVLTYNFGNRKTNVFENNNNNKYKNVPNKNKNTKNNNGGDDESSKGEKHQRLLKNPSAFAGAQSSLVKDSNFGVKNEEVKGGHFMSTMVTVIVMVLCIYILYHNKKKIIAYVLEGKKSGAIKRRQPQSTIKYSTLDNVEAGLNHSPPIQSEGAKNFIF